MYLILLSKHTRMCAYHDDVFELESFSALLALCAGNSPVTGEFPSQRPVTQGFDIFWSVPE